MPTLYRAQYKVPVEGAPDQYAICYFEVDSKSVIMVDDDGMPIPDSTLNSVLDNIQTINDGKAEKPVLVTNIVVPYNTWQGAAAPYSATVTVNGITPNSLFIVSVPSGLNASQYEAYGAAGLTYNTHTDNSLTLNAILDIPTINLSFTVTILEENSETPGCIMSIPGGSGGLKLFKVSTAGEFDKTTTNPSASNRINYNGYLYATRLYGAVYNDYAEYRDVVDKEITPGTVVSMNENGEFEPSKVRLAPASRIISDTYGFAIGEDINAIQLPVAVCGRALVYLDREFTPDLIGAPICAGEDGTASVMTREEVQEYPDRIIGVISSKPKARYWGNDNIDTDGRIWIEVK